MPAREVLLYPDRRLKQVATPAQPGEAERVAADLLDTMDSLGHCVGLAAPQIGRLVRVVAVDVSDHPKAPENNGRLVLVNPRIVASSGSEIGREGCLSIPDLTANVRRATAIAVEHTAGRFESSGFEARCIQHEIDHLDGILFLDRVASLADDLFRRKRYAGSEDRGAGRPPSSS
ncbi:MAG: peptide deformylase [Solirubrobacterales bacterium]|nr:peptide deformylase [Solirubrobacterales bacterium]